MLPRGLWLYFTEFKFGNRMSRLSVFPVRKTYNTPMIAQMSGKCNGDTAQKIPLKSGSFQKISPPNTKPNTDIFYDNVEKEEVPQDCSHHSGQNEVYNPIALPSGLIERTHPLPTEIKDDTPNQKEQPKRSKCPLVVSIKRISQ